MLAKASQFSILFPGIFVYGIKQNLPSYLLKKSPIARFPFSSDKLIVRPNH